MTPVVLYGAPTAEIESALAGWGRLVVRCDDGPEVLVGAMRTGFVWLGARTVLEAALLAEIDSFEERREGRVLVAAFEGIAADGVRVPLGDRVVVAGPGAARFSLSGPAAQRGVESVRSTRVVHLAIPGRIGAHLRAINDESSACAVAADVGGAEPRLADLAAPALATWRAWRGAVGNRDRAFSAAFLEAFAVAAASAKLWERRHPDGEPPL